MQLSSVSQMNVPMRAQNIQPKNENLQNVIKPQISKSEEKKRNKAILIGAGCLAAAATVLTIVCHKQKQSLIKTLKDLEVVKALNQQADDLFVKLKTISQKVSK